MGSLKVLLDLHSDRLEYLESRPQWDKYGKGWGKRCRIVMGVARSCVDHKPTLTEMVNSRIVKGGAVGVAASATAVVTTPPAAWEQSWALIQHLLHDIPGLAGDLPEALKSAEPGMRSAIEQAQQTAAIPGLAGNLGALVMLGSALYTIWRRYRQFAKGRL
jgi:hypothetical protein